MPFGLGFFANTGATIRPFAFALNYVNSNNNNFSEIDLDTNGNLFIGGEYPSKISPDGQLLACKNSETAVPAGRNMPGAFKVNPYDNTIWVTGNSSASERGKLVRYDNNLFGYTQYTFTSSRTSIRVYDVDFYSNGDILICGSTYDASSVERGFAGRMTSSGTFTWVREVFGPTTTSTAETNVMFGCTLDSAERVTLFGSTQSSTTRYMSVITLTAAGAYSARSTYTSSGNFSVNNFLARGVRTFFANGQSHITADDQTVTLRVAENTTTLTGWTRVVGPGGSGNYVIGRYVGEAGNGTTLRLGLSSTPESLFTATQASGWTILEQQTNSSMASTPATASRDAIAVYVQPKDNANQITRYPVGVVLPITTTALTGTATADVTYTLSSQTDVAGPTSPTSSNITISNGTITLSGSTTTGTLTDRTPSSYLSGVFA